MKNTFFIDIETLPDLTPGAREAFITDAKTNIRAPNYTKEQFASELGMTDANEIKFTAKDRLSQMWCDRFGLENAETQGHDDWLKTGFDGGRGRVVVIGVAANDGDSASFAFLDAGGAPDEPETLARFNDFIDNHLVASKTPPCFVGFNHYNFDLPFLFKRYVVNRTRPHPALPFGARPWDDRLCDLMIEWTGSATKYISMDVLAGLLGVQGKGGMTGADVYPAFAAGRVAEIADYCQDDVRMTRDIYKRLRFLE